MSSSIQENCATNVRKGPKPESKSVAIQTEKNNQFVAENEAEIKYGKSILLKIIGIFFNYIILIHLK
jgi:hypothetical protein